MPWTTPIRGNVGFDIEQATGALDVQRHAVPGRPSPQETLEAPWRVDFPTVVNAFDRVAGLEAEGGGDATLSRVRDPRCRSIVGELDRQGRAPRGNPPL